MVGGSVFDACLLVALNFVQRRALVRSVRVEFVEGILALLQSCTYLLLVFHIERLSRLHVRKHVILVCPSDLLSLGLRILWHCFS
jgi:hypothetical protein